MSETLYEIKNEYRACKCFGELIALKQPTVQQNIQNTMQLLGVKSKSRSVLSWHNSCVFPSAIDMLGNENDREITKSKRKSCGSGMVKLSLPLASSTQLAQEVLRG